MMRLRLSWTGLALATLALVAQMSAAVALARAGSVGAHPSNALQATTAFAQLAAIQTICHSEPAGAPGQDGNNNIPAHPLHDANCAVCSFCTSLGVPVLFIAATSYFLAPLLPASLVAATWQHAPSPSRSFTRGAGARAPPVPV